MNSVPSKFVCNEIFRELSGDLGAGWAYDGKKILYHSTGELVRITRYINSS